MTQTPARQSPLVCTPGGPAHNVPDGKAQEWLGRAVGADGAATFTLPNTRLLPRFAAGEHRLVGAVFPPDGPFPGSPPGPPPDPGPPPTS
jgi:hypothetical protein